jgi:hypothetical protein
MSADYVERLVEETLAALPQMFLPSEEGEARKELGQVAELAGRFRASCKVISDFLCSRIFPSLRTHSVWANQKESTGEKSSS